MSDVEVSVTCAVFWEVEDMDLAEVQVEYREGYP